MSLSIASILQICMYESESMTPGVWNTNFLFSSLQKKKDVHLKINTLNNFNASFCEYSLKR